MNADLISNSYPRLSVLSLAESVGFGVGFVGVVESFIFF